MDDPFDTPDAARTFLRPAPGGMAAGFAERRTAGSGSGADTPAPAAAEPPPVDHGLSPLLAAANRLLMMAPALRQTRSVSDPAALRAGLAQGVRDFASTAQQQGVAPERVNAARYILCTLLDESAADTPWGGSGVWGRHSLLAEFHNEAAGGEKVFQLMARLADKPADNRDLLELIYAAIAVGFEGRYRALPGGEQKLESVRAKLAQLLSQARGPYPAPLAQHWQAQAVVRDTLPSWLPLAVVTLLAVLVLGAAYALFARSLAAKSDPVLGQIQALRLPPPVAVVAQKAPTPRLAQFLAPDIQSGIVAVRDEVDRSVVTVRGDGLFAAASASLDPQREELMRRIAQALVRVGGSVMVNGFTDNTPIRTLRFPSNWHLSEERARAVADILVDNGVPRDRVASKGRAESDPVASNDSPANRALNRRVEITLQSARGDAVARPATSPAGPATATAPPPAASR